MSWAPTLYRALLQTTRELRRRSHPLQVRLPLPASRSQWLVEGTPQFAEIPDRSAARADALARVFPGYGQHPVATAAEEIDASQLHEIIRAAFRAPVPLAARNERLDQGLAALRALHEQLALARCSRSVVSEADGGVRVRTDATSMFRGTDRGLFVFQYRICISNDGARPVQVLGRQWEICNADDTVHASVPRHSPGVVGQTPLLQPGEAFEYSSGTTLATPTGRVVGSLQCVTAGACACVRAHAPVRASRAVATAPLPALVRPESPPAPAV